MRRAERLKTREERMEKKRIEEEALKAAKELEPTEEAENVKPEKKQRAKKEKVTLVFKKKGEAEQVTQE